MSMRMRTINEAFDYIKKCDPETSITKTGLRRLITTGVIPSVRVGAKYLVSLEILETRFLSEDNGNGKKEESTAYGTIRRIHV